MPYLRCGDAACTARRASRAPLERRWRASECLGATSRPDDFVASWGATTRSLAALVARQRCDAYAPAASRGLDAAAHAWTILVANWILRRVPLRDRPGGATARRGKCAARDVALHREPAAS